MSQNLNISGPGTVIVGDRCRIAPDVEFIFHQPSKIIIGDYCVIGSGVKFVCDGGDILIGDWTALHDRTLVLSGEGVVIGEHGWFGQHCILDGTGGLTIGNGVRVGMYSQIWSHVAAGEQIEGCTLFGQRPVVLEDDVWLVGSCIVASGVTIGSRTIALIASNITRSWPSNSVIAGSPASAKESLNFYKHMSIEDRWALLIGWLNDAALKLNLTVLRSCERIFVLCDPRKPDPEYITFVVADEAIASIEPKFINGTVCCLSAKTYIKRLSDVEHSVLKYLAGNKARFYQRVQ